MSEVRQEIGKVTVAVKGEWSSATAYAKNDIVSHEGGSYLSVQPVPAGTPLTNANYWLLLSAKGAKGDKGDTGNGIASVSVEEVSVSGAEHNYRMTVTMTDGTVTTYDYTVTDGAVTSVNGRTGEVIGLAEQDGYYELMSVGSADQLISTQYVEDSVPYKFRTSGGSADIGDREIDEIVGGTINWNQLCKALATGNWAAILGTLTFDNGVATFTPSARYGRFLFTPQNLVNGHKYLLKTDIKSYSGSSVHFALGTQTTYGSQGANCVCGATDDAWHTYATVGSFTSGTDDKILFACVEESPQTISVRNAVVFDLTAMFGTEIADYIYNLEQSTAGAGVAWFKKLFPNDYYPYSVPTLTHVSGLSSHDMVGFNQWDEEWESGVYNSSGVKASDSGRIRSKNFIPVLPNTTYYFKNANTGSAWLNLCQYDADKNFISKVSKSNTTYTIPSNVHYLTFDLNNAYGTTYQNDICINLSWSGTRNGEYEPYVKHSYPLDSSLTLMGIPKLDADGNLYYDGDVYPSSGNGYHNYGLVDLGMLEWTYIDAYELFYANVPDKNNLNPNINVICSKYVSSKNKVNVSQDVNGGAQADNTIAGFYNSASTNSWVYVKDTSYTDVAIFKSAMSGVMLVYELATPVPFTAQPYTNPQIVNDWGTEEYVSETIVPVGHNTKYTANLRDKLQHLPDLADSDGYYMIQQTGTDMSLIRFRIPQAPTTDGTYTLQATVSGGTPTYTWVADTAESTEVQA